MAHSFSTVNYFAPNSEKQKTDLQLMNNANKTIIPDLFPKLANSMGADDLKL